MFPADTAPTAAPASPPTSAPVLSLRPLDPAADAPMLHRWVTQDYASFWGMQDRSVDDIRSTYEKVLQRPRSEVFIGSIEGDPRPLVLVECYHGRDDAVLARCYEAREGDRGFHILMAPPSERPKHIPRLGYHVLNGICRHLLADPKADRVIGEPDLRNATVLSLLLQAGFEFGPVVYLPHKTAQMVFLTRQAFERRPAQPPERRPVPVPAATVWLHLQAGKVLRKLGIAR